MIWPSAKMLEEMSGLSHAYTRFMDAPTRVLVRIILIRLLLRSSLYARPPLGGLLYKLVFLV